MTITKATLVAELVRLRPDVIYTASTPGNRSRERDDHYPDHRRSGRRGNTDAACRQLGAPDRKCGPASRWTVSNSTQVPTVPEGVGAACIASGAAAQSDNLTSRLSGHPGTGGYQLA
jgi:hypothetical protein